MAKRYYNLERETKALLKRWGETRGTLPDAAGIARVNEYILRKKGLGELVGGTQKTACKFDLSKSQTLSVASNASLLTGDFDLTLFGWAKFDTLSAYQCILGKGAMWGSGDLTLFLSGSSGNPLCFGVRNIASSAGSRGLNDSFAPVASVSIGSWIFFIAWHDSVNNTINLQVNNGIISSQNWSQGISSSGFNFVVGGHSINSNMMNGSVDNLCYLKTALSTDHRAFLYNSGRGSSYLDIVAYYPNLLTSMVSFWELNEFSGTRRDRHSTNNLTQTNNPLNTIGIVEELF